MVVEHHSARAAPERQCEMQLLGPSLESYLEVQVISVLLLDDHFGSGTLLVCASR